MNYLKTILEEQQHSKLDIDSKDPDAIIKRKGYNKLISQGAWKSVSK